MILRNNKKAIDSKANMASQNTEVRIDSQEHIVEQNQLQASGNDSQGAAEIRIPEVGTMNMMQIMLMKIEEMLGSIKESQNENQRKMEEIEDRLKERQNENQRKWRID